MNLPEPFCGPSMIESEVTLPKTVPLESAVAVFADTLQHYPDIKVVSWSLDRSGKEIFGSIDDLRARLRDLPDTSALLLNLDSRSLNTIHVQRIGERRAHDTRFPRNTVWISFYSHVELNEAETRQALAVQSAILRALCRRPDVLSARMYRNASCYVPNAPEGHDWFPMTIVSRRAVEENYDDPEVYWRSWDSCEDLGGDRVLVTRALDVLDERAYKRTVYPRIWNLIYAARPGSSSRFAVANVRPQDMDHFNEGEDYLQQLGYSAQDQSIEFTAVVPEGEHLRPREIMVLARYRSNGRLPGGEPLQRVKVTFVDEAMARREMRPLLDAGIEVWCYRYPQATLMQVTD